ncbi:MAG: hypothetical protein DSM107014_13175 [Gomphosphaeria aponina SAG 52.96 = DSM 107014]|uniref:Uncharacterized protein n=1 Tax=Gomphosphaeria aponina SAG 52.96 = DSM 107014 TaxID=1521640 RepID=A0A941GS64_9CHRO|nr:hypothetical protein [Gomphosphaeria aponina SAG 52.96 = DSM 107014]
MSLFGLPLLPLLGGFIFLVNFKVTKIRSYRYSGYKLLFYSGMIGIIGNIVTLVLIQLYNTFVPFSCTQFITSLPIVKFFSSINFLPYTPSSILTLFFLGLFWIPLNLCFNEVIVTEEAIKELGSSLERMLLEAQRDDKLIAITLKNRKVYVGYVINAKLSYGAYFDNQPVYLQILPVLSGYREESDFKMNLPINYESVWGNEDKMKETMLTKNDFIVLIQENEIVSVSKFDHITHVRFSDEPGE